MDKSVMKAQRLLTSLVFVLALLHFKCIHGAVFECVGGCRCTGVKINCSSSQLEDIPGFATLQGANYLDLSNNQIEEIDRVLPWEGIEQLQFLYLNANSIYYIIGDSFITLVNLEYVDLSHNFIELLPENLFSGNSRLRTLNLQGNVFHATPLINSLSLQTLDLSFCKLSSFTRHHMRGLPNLKELNLQVNNLVYLQPEVFARHPRISMLLSYNYWPCNCSTVELYRWALDNAPRIVVDETCDNKNNVSVNLYNRTRGYLYKEHCDIDENSFAGGTMKNLSLTKPIEAPDVHRHSASAIDCNNKDDANLYANAWIIFVALALVIVLVAIAVGVVMGVFLGRSFGTQRVKVCTTTLDVEGDFV